MDWLTTIWSQIATYVSVPYLLTFVLLSYFVKRYFEEFLEKITKSKWKTVYTVLILATITAVPFLLWTDISWVKIVFSYALGTSLHELIFKHVEKLFPVN